MESNTTRQVKRQKVEELEDNNDDRPTLPTGRDISLALSQIEITETYPNDKTIKAIDNLLKWLDSRNGDKVRRVIKEFIDIGGILRLLMLIEKNIDNKQTELVKCSATFLHMILDPGNNDQYHDLNIQVAKIFIERRGVQIMILANEKYVNNNDVISFSALICIWKVLSNICYNKKSVDIIGKDQIISIISSGAYAINAPHFTVGYDIDNLQKCVLKAMGNSIRHSDGNTIQFDDFQGPFQEKNIFQQCIRAMRKDGTAINGNHWKNDVDLCGHTSRFFQYCCEKNDKLLYRKADFKIIVPFLIHYIKKDPNDARDWFAFQILLEASDVIGKKTMMKSSKGLLTVLGAIADCDTNVNVDKYAKDAAYELMEYLFNK
jgi:hypothetical protein